MSEQKRRPGANMRTYFSAGAASQMLLQPLFSSKLQEPSEENNSFEGGGVLHL